MCYWPASAFQKDRQHLNKTGTEIKRAFVQQADRFVEWRTELSSVVSAFCFAADQYLSTDPAPVPKRKRKDPIVPVYLAGPSAWIRKKGYWIRLNRLPSFLRYRGKPGLFINTIPSDGHAPPGFFFLTLSSNFFTPFSCPIGAGPVLRGASTPTHRHTTSLNLFSKQSV